VLNFKLLLLLFPLPKAFTHTKDTYIWRFHKKRNYFAPEYIMQVPRDGFSGEQYHLYGASGNWFIIGIE
jgi:hypothetical protein